MPSSATCSALSPGVDNAILARPVYELVLLTDVVVGRIPLHKLIAIPVICLFGHYELAFRVRWVFDLAFQVTFFSERPCKASLFFLRKKFDDLTLVPFSSGEHVIFNPELLPFVVFLRIFFLLLSVFFFPLLLSVFFFLLLLFVFFFLLLFVFFFFFFFVFFLLLRIFFLLLFVFFLLPRVFFLLLLSVFSFLLIIIYLSLFGLRTVIVG